MVEGKKIDEWIAELENGKLFNYTVCERLVVLHKMKKLYGGAKELSPAISKEGGKEMI